MTASGSPPRILVVDDDGMIREVAVRMLQRLGCVVEVACDGAQAVKAVRGSRFDLVLMDAQMPVMDGYDATRAIRDAEDAGGSPRVPILSMTGSRVDTTRQRCLDAGMDGHLDKPFGSDSLAAMLRRWVARDGDVVDVVPSSDALPAIDPDQLAAYGAGGGQDGQGHDRMERLVERFVASAEDDVGAIRRAVDAGDVAEMAHAAHNLAGSSAVVGARALAALGRRLEGLAAGTAVEPDVGALLAEIEAELGRSTLALRAAARAPRRPR